MSEVAGGQLGTRERAFYLEDWLNPVLLKEVRQALRGKYFRVCFWISLCAVTVVTTGVLINTGNDGIMTEDEGRVFASSVCVCLAVAVLGFLPFSAFNSMGAEWDENTYDLLVISNVRPRGIVLGKLLATSIQAFLIYSTFTPFFVLASLMQGVDLQAMLVILAGNFVFSSVLTVVAICLSTLTRVRFARIVLMAALSAMLVYATIGGIFMAQFLINEPGVLQDPETPEIALSMVLPHLIVGAYAAGLACVMLAHSEENRSSGMRILTSVSLLASIAWVYFMSDSAGAEVVSAMGTGLVAALCVPCLFFVTEAERFPRRVRHCIAQNPIVALLTHIYLPGGARGWAFFLLHLCVLVAAVFGIRAQLSGFVGIDFGDGGLACLVAVLYALIYLGLPSGLLASFTHRTNLRMVVRAIIPILALAFAILPAIVGFFAGNTQLMGGRHPGNPIFLMERYWDAGFRREGAALALLGLLVLLAFLLNLRRSVRALSETLTASSALRAGAVKTTQADHAAS